MSGNIHSAFHAICTDAEHMRGVFLSLYRREPFYGGPEEGGWWGDDTILEASQRFTCEEDAENAKEDIESLARKLSETARRDWGQQCLDEIEWCEQRNLDHESFLPETAGPTRYFVVLEQQRGSLESQGDRHYS